MSNNVLILCTGNSCRSQMAQVLWHHLSDGQWNSCSAGSKPSGYVHPLAIAALRELGLPTNDLSSKPIDDIDLAGITLVVTVCDNAAADCPRLPVNLPALHWPFDDPAEAKGNDEEKMQTFRRVRNEIKEQIVAYLATKKRVQDA